MCATEILSRDINAFHQQRDIVLVCYPQKFGLIRQGVKTFSHAVMSCELSFLKGSLCAVDGGEDGSVNEKLPGLLFILAVLKKSSRRRRARQILI